jgi:hypothetical protein
MNLKAQGDQQVSSLDRSVNYDSNSSNLAQSPANPISSAHRRDLKASGLNDEQIAKTGHFSANAAEVKALVGISQPGLIFSYCDLRGQPYLTKAGQPFYRVKPDWGDRKTEDSPKYLSPKDEGSRPYFSRLNQSWEKIWF